MSTLLVRWIFAALCGVFYVAIGGVASWEWIRFKRRESALSPRHFRLRILSAITWMFVLGAFFVLTVWLWPDTSVRAPTPAQREELLRASKVFLGAFTLMLLAFCLMTLDMFWTIQVGRQGVAKRARQTQDTLKHEMERTKRTGGDPNGRL